MNYLVNSHESNQVLPIDKWHEVNAESMDEAVFTEVEKAMRDEDRRPARVSVQKPGTRSHLTGAPMVVITYDLDYTPVPNFFAFRQE